MLKGFYRVALLGLSSIASTFGYASAADTYGIGARSVSLGNAAVTGSTDAYQAFSNPAALTDSDRPLLSFDFTVTDLRLNDLSGLAQNSPSGLPTDAYRASRANDLRGSSLGINLPLFEGVHFGLAGYMPNGNFGRIWGATSDDSTYLRYSDRQQRPAIYTALAARLGAGWSIGAGAYYTLKARGILQMALAQEASAARFQLEMEPILIPYGGIQWAGEKFKFGLVYRAEQAETSMIDTDLAINFDSASLPFSLQSTLAPFYDPEMFRFGGAYEGDTIRLYTSAEFSRWSGYLAPQLALSGADIGLVSQGSARPSLNLNDTWAYRGGIEFRAGRFADFENLWRLGFEHHSSATGSRSPQSIVDLTRNVIALGYGLQVLEGVLADDRAARFEIAYQRTLLQDQTYRPENAASVTAGGTMHTLVGGFQYEL
ncbi:MAG: OmpP1/FadL family transporter [Oligoflexus sp.]